MNVAQQERLNKRQVHAQKIENAYQDAHGAAIDEMSLIELNIRRKDLEKHHTEFEKEHKALVATLQEENFRIATDVANIIDKMHVSTLVKYETRLFELIKADDKKSKKKQKKKAKKIKEFNEMQKEPKAKKKKRKAELLMECFGPDSDNENKRRKVQENTCTVTSMSDNVTIQEKSSVPCNNELLSNENVKLEPQIVNDLRDEINTKSNERADMHSNDKAETCRDTKSNEKANMHSKDIAERNQWSRPDYKPQRSWHTNQPMRSKSLKCYYCQGSHPMSNCKAFESMSILTRRREVDRLNLCRNCFAPSLSRGGSHQCTMGPCRCGSYHNRLVCDLIPPRRDQQKQNQN